MPQRMYGRIACYSLYILEVELLQTSAVSPLSCAAKPPRRSLGETAPRVASPARWHNLPSCELYRRSRHSTRAPVRMRIWLSRPPIPGLVGRLGSDPVVLLPGLPGDEGAGVRCASAFGGVWGAVSLSGSTHRSLHACAHECYSTRMRTGHAAHSNHVTPAPSQAT